MSSQTDNFGISLSCTTNDSILLLAQLQSLHKPLRLASHQEGEVATRVELYFTDSQTDFYERSSLQELSFFRNDAKTVQFLHISQAHFKTIFRLVVEKLPLHQAIPETLFCDFEPDLIEKLCKTLLFFNPAAQENEELITKIKNDLPNHLSLAQAKAVREKWSTAKALEKNEPVAASSSSSSSSSSAAVEPSKVPLLALRAEEMCLQVYLFPTEKEASAYFEEISACQVEKELAEHHIVGLERSYLRYQTTVHGLEVVKQIQTQKEEVMALTKDLIGLKKKYNLQTLSMIERQRLALFIESDDLALKKVATEAKKMLDAHKESVLAALKECGADLLREDLLSYLIGPKAYLFDYYGYTIEANVHEKGRGPFRHSGHGFLYRQDNPGPYVMEQEMRDDLTRKKIELPAPWITEVTFTKKQTVEAVKVRAAILPILQRWERATKEEEILVNEELLKHFKWHSQGLSTDDIEINVDQTSLQQERIKVHFVKIKWNIILNLWDLETIYKWDFPHEVRPMPLYEVWKKDAEEDAKRAQASNNGVQ